jgi:hypothetical protein
MKAEDQWSDDQRDAAVARFKREVNPADYGGAFRNGRPSILRWEPDRYHDEPDPAPARIAAAEEIRLRRKIQRDAIFFAVSIDNLSRTKKSATIRKEAARFLICKPDHPLRIAEPLGCSASQFYRAVQWVKKHVGFHE